MREGLVLVWFYNDNCRWCVELQPEVEQFAQSNNALLVQTPTTIIDPESGEPSVPALMYNHPKVENHIFVGRFCLDALRYRLENG